MAKTIILITGANQGLGLETVKRLSTTEQNLHIILAGRSMSKVRSAVASLEPAKHSTNTLQGLELDVTVDVSINAAVAKIEAEHTYLDVLFNNAGIWVHTAKTLREEYASTFDTNVFGAAVLTEACIPLLKKSFNPRIIFMSSGLGSISHALDPAYPFYGIDTPAYNASKAAVNRLAAHYAVKYGKEGFKVNACNPGFRKTNMTGYAAMAGDVAEGAINGCRLIMLGKDGENGTFTEVDGPLGW